MRRNNILIYIQQDATLHSLFYLETALHVSGGTTTHHQKSKQMYLHHLVFVTPLPSCTRFPPRPDHQYTAEYHALGLNSGIHDGSVRSVISME
jgi:hypothetical protein